MSTKTDALQRAIDYLGAVKVAEGRYAFLTDLNGRDVYRVASAADMEKCGALLPRGEDDAPPEWAMNEAIMPFWWAPDKRVRYCVDAPDCTGHTADLETGAEVPA